MIGLAGPGQLPVYIAFHNSLVGVRGLVGPYLGTALHDGVGLSVTSVYWIITGVAVAGVALMAIFIGSRAGSLRRS
jgi:hypothetical protein